MNREQFIEFHKQLTDRALAISSKKNHDYCGTQVKDNPFANLQLVEKMGICSTEIGIMTRISDKLSRINSFLQQGVLLVEDEKIDDTVLDSLNYIILLAAVISDRRNNNVQ
jgi:hypothetical protein